MSRLFRSIFAALLFCSSLNAAAQNEVPPPVQELAFDTSAAPEDAFTQDIRQLLTLTGAAALDTKMAGISLKESLKGNESEFTKKFYERFIYEMTEGRAKQWLTNLYIRAYRRYFSPSEIKQLIVFYQTPLGKKISAQLPDLMGDVMKDARQIGMYLGARISEELMNEGNK
jgi:hypothetical protein